MENYIQFAYSTFKEKIFPILSDTSFYQVGIKENNILLKEAIEYCKFEDELSGRRFYPSSLFITCYSAFSGSVPEEKHYEIAAAIELFHNSSLCHDDVIDNHTIRREKETIVKTQGPNVSVLVGNTMLAMAQAILMRSFSTDMKAVHTEFVRSQFHLNYGQYLDEGVVWKKLKPNQWRSHWENIIHYKMTAGFLALRLAAILSGKEHLIEYVDKYEYNMSLVSQIINDTGDLYKFYGYYMTTKTLRDEGEEITQKVTYPLIWAFENISDIDLSKFGNELTVQKLKDLLMVHNFYENVQREVLLLKEDAATFIQNLVIPSSYTNMVLDFTRKPKLPELL